MRAWIVTAAFTVAALAPAAESGAEPAERTSTSPDQQSVNLTIYNGSTALVHDRRTLPLETGSNRIAWRGVSATMDATSAILEDVSAPGAVHVIEQNFDFDLLKPQTILDKYVGQDVTVVHDRTSTGRAQRETAKVLATNEGIVLQYKDRIETAIDGHLEFPGIPPALRDQPTLVLDLDSEGASDANLDLSYLTGGLEWHADYVGVVSPDETHVDIGGLVTLSNTSGTTYRDAHVQLVAGNVNIAPATLRRVYAKAAATSFQPPHVQEENYFEYHLYTLQRTTTIANNQTKQVSLLAARNVPIHKTLELRGDGSYYGSQSNDLGTKLRVGVYETFTNRGGDLGVPLPGGNVRLYKNDSAGTSQFLGSDTIDHTPRNEDVRLHLGDSFDVTANKKQTDYRATGSCLSQSSYDIVLKNAKDEAATVSVIEQIPGDWTIAAENVPHRKTSSSTATWQIAVPANGSAKLEYTAVVKTCP